MKPDATQHNPDPEFIRGLIARAGLSQVAAAKRIGIAPRTMRAYVARGTKNQPAPYLVQFALEALAQ